MTTSAMSQAQVHLLHLLGWTLQRSKIIPQEHSAWRPEQQSKYAGEAYRQTSHNSLYYPCFHRLNKNNLTPNPLETWLVSGMPFSHVILRDHPRAGLCPGRSSRSYASHHFFHLTDPLVNSLTCFLFFSESATLQSSWITESVYSFKCSGSCTMLGCERPCHAGMRCSPCPQKAHSPNIEDQHITPNNDLIAQVSSSLTESAVVSSAPEPVLCHWNSVNGSTLEEETQSCRNEYLFIYNENFQKAYIIPYLGNPVIIGQLLTKQNGNYQ